MREQCVIGFVAVASAAAALLLAPIASAEPGDSNLPVCTTTGSGNVDAGTTTTECSTAGNVEIDATAPEPVYTYPWDDEFYGPALIIGPGIGRR